MRLKQRHNLKQNDYRQSGFTLLELLMVVTILSSTAMVAMMTFDGSTSHHRIVDTENRLKLIKQAIVKTSVDYEGVTHISGYVVDNGILPDCMAGFMEANGCGASLSNAQMMIPVYDPNPNGTTFFNDGNTGTAELYPVQLSDAEHKLWKGFRSVYFGNVVQDQFRDSWGNSDSVPANEWGWSRALSSTGKLTYTSFGRDGISDGLAATFYPSVSDIPYQDQDQSVEVLPSEWHMGSGQVIQVNLSNKSGHKIMMDGTDDLYTVAILEYKNGNGSQGWKQHFSNSYLAPDLNDSDATTLLMLENDETISFTLSQGLAIGQHLITLVSYNSGGTPNVTNRFTCVDDGSGSGTADNGACESGEKRRLAKKITVYPVTGLNTINWEIK